MPFPVTSQPRRADLGLSVILAVALALRVWRLSDKNLWLDESASWDFSTSSLTQLLHWTSADIHPPLYFLLLKGWIGLWGDSLAGLRSLSVVSSLLAVYLMFRLAAGHLTRGVLYAALLWFAVSPHAISSGQEARMYAPATAAVLAVCLSYRQWVDSRFRSRSALVAYIGCVTVALYLHYFTVLAVAAIWLHAILLTSRRDARVDTGSSASQMPWMAWLLAHAAIAAFYLPWIGIAASQITRGQPWWRQPVLVERIPYYAGELLRLLTFGDYGGLFVGSVPAVLATCVLALGLFGITRQVIRNASEERDAFFACVALVPLLIGLALLLVAGHMDLSRYLSFASPLLILAVARGLSALHLRPVHATGILLIGIAALFPSLRAYYGSPVRDSDARPLVAYLSKAARHEPGRLQDRIFVAPGYMTSPLRYVSRGSLAYVGVYTETDLSEVLAAARSQIQPVWLIVDYRWRGFADISADERLEEQKVPSATPHKIKLFRMGPKQPTER